MLNLSQSEIDGISILTNEDTVVYCVGISTAGLAEVQMAKNLSTRQIIATTIDLDGIAFTNKYIADSNYQKQIQTKIEDVSLPLPYPDNYFDFVYARQVLHRLPKHDFANALTELYRILKPGKKIYIVVRSIKCPDASREGVIYDEETDFTRGQIVNVDGSIYKYARFFHTPDTISKYLTEAKFKIESIREYPELLYRDYQRTIPADDKDELIEVIAVK